MCSTWVMMNKKTRRFSKMPNEVRGEISPHFLERSAIDNKDLVTQKIKKLGDDSAQLVCSGLTVWTPLSVNFFLLQPHSVWIIWLILIKIQTSFQGEPFKGNKDNSHFISYSSCQLSFLQPRRNDLDMNQHVNNVKYIGWMMEVRNKQSDLERSDIVWTVFKLHLQLVFIILQESRRTVSSMATAFTSILSFPYGDAWISVNQEFLWNLDLVNWFWLQG